MSGLECLAISIRGSNSSKAQTVHSILLSNFFRVDFPSCAVPPRSRSEEHTSELQSQSNLVCRLLLEKNIVQYLGELGAEVVVRRNDEVTLADVDAMHPERIVVSPEPCTPQKAGISIELIRHFAGKSPVLGVCLGHQAIGAAFGGKVVRAPNLMHGKTSQVQHDGRTIFGGLPSPMTATRYHSLLVSDA